MISGVRIKLSFKGNAKAAEKRILYACSAHKPVIIHAAKYF